jgi:hypothetical protein
VLIHSQVGEKGLDPCDTHFIGVALVVEQNVTCDPVDAGLLVADGIVLEPDGLADLFSSFLGRCSMGTLLRVDWEGVLLYNIHSKDIAKKRHNPGSACYAIPAWFAVGVDPQWGIGGAVRRTCLPER